MPRSPVKNYGRRALAEVRPHRQKFAGSGRPRQRADRHGTRVPHRIVHIAPPPIRPGEAAWTRPLSRSARGTAGDKQFTAPVPGWPRRLEVAKSLRRERSAFRSRRERGGVQQRRGPNLVSERSIQRRGGARDTAGSMQDGHGQANNVKRFVRCACRRRGGQGAAVVAVHACGAGVHEVVFPK